MAEWKKLVVSGSNISQLFNDTGYLTAGTITQANGYATASVGGTELIAASSTASLTFASSSGQGVTLAGSSPGGVNTITVGLSAIPNASLANSSSTIGTTNIPLGATVSTLDGLTSVTATNFTGTASYATLATTALSATSASFASTASYVTTLNQNVIISGALDISLSPYSSNLQIAGNGFGQTYLSSNGALILNPGSGGVGMAGVNQYITAGYFVGQTAGTILTGSLLGTSSYADSASQAINSVSAISSSYALTASFALNAPTAENALTASNITPAITNELDNRVLTANGGGTINGEANLTFDGTNLILNGNQTISGDLTVNGTTTTINTQNLNVADKFILLSSGSTSPNDGGIIIQSEVGGIGFAFLYDQGQARWAYTGSLSSTATTASPDAFAAMVIDLNVAESTDKAVYRKNGNIKVEVGGDIYIYA
jgi:hypothetical protein